MTVILLCLAVLTGYGPWEATGPQGGDLNAPVQSPQDSQELWALSGANPTQVVHSTDGGESWETLSSFSGSTPYDMVICSDGKLVAGGSSRTWTSSDGGSTWTSHSFSNTIFYDLCVNSSDPMKVYGCGYAYSGSWKAAFMISTDGGESFTVSFLPVSPSSSYSYGRASAAGPGNDPVLLAGGYEYSSTDATYTPFVYKSTDGGVTFTDITPQEALSQYYFYGLGVDPVNPDILLAGSLYSMYRSTDGGGSWTKVSPNQTYNYNITYSGADPDIVMAAGMNRTYISTDGGIGWTTVTSGLSGVTGIQWVIPDRSSTSLAYTASSEGFHRSETGGTSWTSSNSGLLVGRVMAMAESQGWIFMNMEDMGVFKTPSTGSVNWEEVNTPLSCGDFCDICADGSGTLLALEGTG